MSSVERLVVKLRAAGYQIGYDWTFNRHYPGHWQRAAGAWVWSIHSGLRVIGSPDTVKNCLRAERFSDGPHGEVYPITRDQSKPKKKAKRV